MAETPLISNSEQPLVSQPTAPVAPKRTPLQSIASGLLNPVSIPGTNDLGLGAVKSLTNTLQNVGNLVLKPVNAGLNALGVSTPTTGFSKEQLAPTNTMQKIGGAIEQGAEFLIPETKALQVPGFANILGHFATNATVRAAQGGGVKDSLIAGGIGSALSSFKPIAEVFKPTFVKGLSMISGFNENVLNSALSRTPGAVGTVAKGEVELNNIVQKTASNLSDYASKTLQNSKDTVSELTKLSGGMKGYPGTRAAIIREGRQFVSNITKNLRSEMNIGVKTDGSLLFSRPTMASNIVSRSDQSAIQDAFNLVKGIDKDTSIKNIDSVLERMISLKSKTPVGSPTGGETRKIIGGMMDEVVKFTKSLSSFSPAYEKYAQFIEKNLQERVFINDAKELFGASKNLSPKEVTQITTRLLQMFNSGRTAIRGFADTVGSKVGTDLVGGAAGTLMNAGDQISIRAQNLTARGVAARVFEAVPRSLLKNYVATGHLSNPFIQSVLKTTGVASNVLIQELAKMLESQN